MSASLKSRLARLERVAETLAPYDTGPEVVIYIPDNGRGRRDDLAPDQDSNGKGRGPDQDQEGKGSVAICLPVKTDNPDQGEKEEWKQ